VELNAGNISSDVSDSDAEAKQKMEHPQAKPPHSFGFMWM